MFRRKSSTQSSTDQDGSAMPLFRKSAAEPGALSECYHRVLQRCRMMLLKEVEVHEVLEALAQAQEEGFKPEVREQVASQATRELRMSALLDRIENRGDKSFHVFLETMRLHYRHIHYVLEETLRNIDDVDESGHRDKIDVSAEMVRKLVRGSARRRMESDAAESADELDLYLDDRSDELYLDCYSIPLKGRMARESWIKHDADGKQSLDSDPADETTYMATLVRATIFRKIEAKDIPNGVKIPPRNCVVYMLDEDQVWNAGSKEERRVKEEAYSVKSSKTDADTVIEVEPPSDAPPVPPKPCDLPPLSPRPPIIRSRNGSTKSDKSRTEEKPPILPKPKLPLPLQERHAEALASRSHSLSADSSPMNTPQLPPRRRNSCPDTQPDQPAVRPLSLVVEVSPSKETLTAASERESLSRSRGASREPDSQSNHSGQFENIDAMSDETITEYQDGQTPTNGYDPRYSAEPHPLNLQLDQNMNGDVVDVPIKENVRFDKIMNGNAHPLNGNHTGEHMSGDEREGEEDYEPITPRSSFIDENENENKREQSPEIVTKKNSFKKSRENTPEKTVTKSDQSRGRGQSPTKTQDRSSSREGSPAKGRGSSPGKTISPDKGRGKSPEKVRSTSDKGKGIPADKGKATSPEQNKRTVSPKGRGSSPDKSRPTSPGNTRAKSPEPAKGKSPLRFRMKSTKKAKSKSKDSDRDSVPEVPPHGSKSAPPVEDHTSPDDKTPDVSSDSADVASPDDSCDSSPEKPPEQIPTGYSEKAPVKIRKDELPLIEELNVDMDAALEFEVPCEYYSQEVYGGEELGNTTADQNGEVFQVNGGVESPERNSLTSNKSNATDSGVESTPALPKIPREKMSLPLPLPPPPRSRGSMKKENMLILNHLMPRSVSDSAALCHNIRDDSSDDDSFYEDIDHLDTPGSHAYLDPKTPSDGHFFQFSSSLKRSATWRIPLPVEERVLINPDELLVTDHDCCCPLPLTEATNSEDRAAWKDVFLAYDKRGRALYVPGNILKKHGDPEGEPWFYPIPIASRQAALFLSETRQEGCFIVYRPSNRNASAIYNLSVCRANGDVVHYHVMKNIHGDVMLEGHDQSFMNVADLIQYLQRNKSRLATRLRRPLSEAYLPLTPGHHFDSRFEIVRVALSLTGQIIGKGQFGVVCAGSYRRFPVAVKVLQKSDATLTEEDDFIEEARMLMTMKHEHIIRLIGVSCTARPFFLVTELASLGNLRDCLRKNQIPHDTMDTLFDVCIQITSAMYYLESKQWVIHRDLAARNCLVTEDMCIKLADFGRAVYVTDNIYQAPTSETIPIKWAAPEVLTDSLYSSKSDVWALGIVFWEVFSGGERPYPNLNSEQAAIFVSEGGRLEKPTGCSVDLYSQMKCCWRRDPDVRPSFSTLYERLKSKSSIEYGPIHQRYSTTSDTSLGVRTLFNMGTPNSAPPVPKYNPQRKAATLGGHHQLGGGSDAPMRDFSSYSLQSDSMMSPSSLGDRIGTSSSETSLVSSTSQLKDDLTRSDKIRKSIRKMMHVKSKRKTSHKLELTPERPASAGQVYTQ